MTLVLFPAHATFHRPPRQVLYPPWTDVRASMCRHLPCRLPERPPPRLSGVCRAPPIGTAVAVLQQHGNLPPETEDAGRRARIRGMGQGERGYARWTFIWPRKKHSEAEAFWALNCCTAPRAFLAWLPACFVLRPPVFRLQPSHSPDSGVAFGAQ